MAGRRKRRTSIVGQFTPRLIEMLESPAYRVLSLSARRILDRLEIELGHYGGGDNGRLIVTYDQFQAYGMDRHAIGPALRELVNLGFVEVIVQGRAANAEHKTPSQYRLTTRHTDKAEPTHEWRMVETMEQAQTIAAMARNPRRLKLISGGGKSPIPVGETHAGNRTLLVG